MIKFFRKIRQNLLSEGKTGKYFKYAIGEIVLVVIGILIALQINNWNIKVKEKNTERLNLIALKEEFKENKNELNNVIALNAQIITGTKKLIQTFKVSTLDTISEQTIAINLSEALSREINFVQSSGVLSEMLSSGELKLIQNIELKHHLAGFGSWIERNEQQENEVNQFRKDITTQILKSGSFKKIITELGSPDFNWETSLDSVKNKSLFNSIELLNHLIVFKSASEITARQIYGPLSKEIDTILKLINSELNK